MVNQYQKTNNDIVQYILDQENEDPVYCELSPKHNPEYCLALWFYAAKYNCRLTVDGVWFMKRWFQVNTIYFTHQRINIRPYHLLTFAKNIKTPYYINHAGRFLEIFNEEDAIELILLDGDLDQYVRINKS